MSTVKLNGLSKNQVAEYQKNQHKLKIRDWKRFARTSKFKIKILRGYDRILQVFIPMMFKAVGAWYPNKIKDIPSIIYKTKEYK